MEEENNLDDHNTLFGSEDHVEMEVPNLDTVVSKNLDDPRHWKNISSNLRDLLVERGPVQICDIEFPKDKF